MHRQVRLVLPPAATSPGAARRFALRTLAEADWRGEVDTVLLGVSEAVTNAVLHAGTDVEVVLDVAERRVRVAVADGGPGLPAPRSYPPSAATGRGLDLLAALTTAHGVEPTHHGGKVVWFRIDAEVNPELNPGSNPELNPGSDPELSAGTDVGPDGAVRSNPVGSSWAGQRLPGQPLRSGSVRLDRLPVTLWRAAQEHHDALLRELQLLSREASARKGRVSLDTLASAQRMHATLVEAVARATGTDPYLQPATRDAALDVVLALRPADGADLAALQDVLDAGERAASAGRLLARPGLPEVVAVRDWVCEQGIAQLAGVPPTPWSPPWAGRWDPVEGSRTGWTPTSRDPDRFRRGAPQWDDSAIRASTRPVVAADDGNRIVAVSEPMTRLLGRPVDDLVGERVVTLVPPRLREQHVVGFTRHLTTGLSRLGDARVEMPVLHGDGQERLCGFRLEHAATGDGRTVYLAWFDAEPDG